MARPATRLVDPHPRLQRSYLAASDEFAASGEQRDGDGDWVDPPRDDYPGFTFTREGLTDPAEFERFVAQRRRARDADAPRRPGWVACTFLWMVDDHDDYVGSVALRHDLTPFLLREGGHVGYSVRPSARRRGHATAALRLVLPLARDRLGLVRVLLTCLETNTASRRVIEACGGVHEDSVADVRRYWVPTTQDGAP